MQDLRSELAGGIFNVLTGCGRFRLNYGAGLGDALLCDEACGGKRCLLLRGPLLDAQFAVVEDFRPRGAEFGLVFLGLGVG